MAYFRSFHLIDWSDISPFPFDSLADQAVQIEQDQSLGEMMQMYHLTSSQLLSISADIPITTSSSNGPTASPAGEVLDDLPDGRLS